MGRDVSSRFHRWRVRCSIWFFQLATQTKGEETQKNLQHASPQKKYPKRTTQHEERQTQTTDPSARPQTREGLPNGSQDEEIPKLRMSGCPDFDNITEKRIL